MQYELEKLTLKSRRGDYQVAMLPNCPIVWRPLPLDLKNSRHLDVVQEVAMANNNQLALHKYWQDEPEHFISQYQKLYKELFGLKWLHKNEDRHSLVANTECCLTLVQYHNHRLIAYSRSTDMKNGYFSDKIVLEYLAQLISKLRPDCKVDTIEWFMAIPHVYIEPGIARLKKDEETT